MSSPEDLPEIKRIIVILCKIVTRVITWITLTVSTRERGPRLPGVGTSTSGPVGVAPGVPGVGVAPPGARVLLAMVAGALA